MSSTLKSGLDTKDLVPVEEQSSPGSSECLQSRSIGRRISDVRKLIFFIISLVGISSITGKSQAQPRDAAISRDGGQGLSDLDGSQESHDDIRFISGYDNEPDFLISTDFDISSDTITFDIRQRSGRNKFDEEIPFEIDSQGGIFFEDLTDTFSRVIDGETAIYIDAENADGYISRFEGEISEGSVIISFPKSLIKNNYSLTIPGYEEGVEHKIYPAENIQIRVDSDFGQFGVGTLPLPDSETETVVECSNGSVTKIGAGFGVVFDLESGDVRVPNINLKNNEDGSFTWEYEDDNIPNAFVEEDQATGCTLMGNLGESGEIKGMKIVVPRTTISEIFRNATILSGHNCSEFFDDDRDGPEPDWLKQRTRSIRELLVKISEKPFSTVFSQGGNNRSGSKNRGKRKSRRKMRKNSRRKNRGK